MKKLIIHTTLFLFPFITGALLLFIMPIDKKFNYHFVKGECNDKASWIHHRIFENEKEIDIVFSGASQTGCAIMDADLEQKLTNSFGRKINIANLGYCRRGRDVQFVMLKDLFKQKQPKFLIVEVAEDEPKKSHPVFPYLAETEDLLGSAILLNYRFVSSIWKGLVVRFEYLKFKVFLIKTKNHDYSDFSYVSSTVIAANETIKENTQIWNNRLSNTKTPVFRKLGLNYSKHYLQKIADLADQNNCDLLFLYLPESGSKLKEPLLLDDYESIAPVLTLPDSIPQNSNNWMDATHFNDFGAKEVSNFLIPELKKRMPNL